VKSNAGDNYLDEHRAAPGHDLTQHHGPGVSGQPLVAALNVQGLVEARGDRL